MEKRLEGALRQYKHNHAKGGFVFAYDKYTIDCIFADLRKLVKDFSWIPCEYSTETTAYKLWFELINLLKREGE